VVVRRPTRKSFRLALGALLSLCLVLVVIGIVLAIQRGPGTGASKQTQQLQAFFAQRRSLDAEAMALANTVKILSTRTPRQIEIAAANTQVVRFQQKLDSAAAQVTSYLSARPRNRWGPADAELATSLRLFGAWRQQSNIWESMLISAVSGPKAAGRSDDLLLQHARIEGAVAVLTNRPF
jgi:uncharacterized protein HemX